MILVPVNNYHTLVTRHKTIVQVYIYSYICTYVVTYEMLNKSTYDYHLKLCATYCKSGNFQW